MGSMGASPAGLLLLALALICGFASLVDGSNSVVTTTVTMGPGAVLKFTSQRCVSVPQTATRPSSVQVSWGRASSSKVDSGSGSKPGAISCSQIKFFEKARCQGKEVDSMVQPATPAGEFSFSGKSILTSAPMLSVLCTVTLNSSDPACAALACDHRDGTCVVEQNDSFPASRALSDLFNEKKLVPYCACPQGYGITKTKCVKGGTPTVSSTSFTLIADTRASSEGSQPYTFRLNLNNCTQFPEAVAGKYATAYTVDNIRDAPKCVRFKNFLTDNCAGDPADKGRPCTSTYVPVPFNHVLIRVA
ncbi:unnamed protein product [Closterium sp. Yama58-4]|nr:unnamed protein product [Closterium sp. Yama58-4]